MRSVLMNLQCILNKVSLNRNTQKTRLYLIDKNFVTRGAQEPNPVFPLGAVVQDSRIRSSQ